MKRILPIILLIALAFISCTANAVNPSDIDTSTWEGLFKVYWNVMNEDYVHFSRNDISWDAMYDEYLPKFQELNYDNANDSLKAFKYFKEMAKDITDYHYSLSVVDKSGVKLSFSPALERKWSTSTNAGSINYFPDIKYNDTTYQNVNGTFFSSADREKEFNYIDGYYEIKNLGSNFHNSSTITFDYEISGDITKYDPSTDNDKEKAAWILFMAALGDYVADDLQFYFGITNTKVAYFYFSQFPDLEILDINNEKVKRSYKDIEYLGVKPYELLSTAAKTYVDNFSKNLNTALDMLSSIANTDKAKVSDTSTLDVKGVVIDVRSNGGGAVEFVHLLTGIFFKDGSSKVVGQNRYKAGYDRYSYTPWFDVAIEGLGEREDGDYPNHVAIITNGNSVSCSELTTLTVKEFLNSKQFGSTTWGGTCSLTNREIYQSGPYELKNANGDTILSIYSTTYQFRANDGTSYEGVGIAPTDYVAESSTEDKRFEEAIKWAAE